jgi:CheY-like chemotaxis protein
MQKILIVDDHSDIRRLIRITLGKNYQVLEAEDGETALAIAASQRPDLMVLDVMMPGTMDGLQVLDAMKQDAELRQIRVIMVTARGQTRDYETGMARGADAYFVKPFSPLQLVSAIKDILAGKETT